MPKIKNIEKRIWDVEGFAVTIRHPNGVDVKGNKDGLPQYPYERAAKNDMTVSEWKNKRFSQVYPGYTVDVLNGSTDDKVTGQTKLGSVRDTYDDSDD